ncbi:hypothetical protein LCGC14_2545830 [marine sediment metagenome]|uniref:ArnR1-like winged helix-turn-helix domain-containing protein n=1 Tax=marine sediment metagenome TaxID=412755 RepID=A0A0F9APU0_9ZZZZ
MITEVNSVIATFGLYSGSSRERLTFWELWDERSAEVGNLGDMDIFASWLGMAVSRGFVKQNRDETYQLTSVGRRRVQQLNRMIEENQEEFGTFEFDL